MSRRGASRLPDPEREPTGEWAWLEERPVFTTHGEKGGNVTRVPPDAVLEPFRPGFACLIAGLAVSSGLMIAGAGLVVAGLSEGLGPGSWWWLALALPTAVLAVFFFAGVHVRGMELLMRERPRNLFVLTGLLAGTAVGLGVPAAWWSRRAADIGLHPEIIEYPGWNHEQRYWAVLLGIGAAVAAAGCLLSAAAAARGARRARRDVARILRLRATGTRHSAAVIRLPDPASWDRGGDVPIRYRDDAGEHVIRARLNTYAHEIPVPGTRVIVFTDDDGDLLVELDPGHPLVYHLHSRPYESDTSGGGSM